MAPLDVVKNIVNKIVENKVDLKLKGVNWNIIFFFINLLIGQCKPVNWNSIEI